MLCRTLILKGKADLTLVGRGDGDITIVKAGDIIQRIGSHDICLSGTAAGNHQPQGHFVGDGFEPATAGSRSNANSNWRSDTRETAAQHRTKPCYRGTRQSDHDLISMSVEEVSDIKNQSTGRSQ